MTMFLYSGRQRTTLSSAAESSLVHDWMASKNKQASSKIAHSQIQSFTAEKAYKLMYKYTCILLGFWGGWGDNVVMHFISVIVL